MNLSPPEHAQVVIRCAHGHHRAPLLDGHTMNVANAAAEVDKGNAGGERRVLVAQLVHDLGVIEVMRLLDEVAGEPPAANAAGVEPEAVGPLVEEPARGVVAEDDEAAAPVAIPPALAARAGQSSESDRLGPGGVAQSARGQ